MSQLPLIIAGALLVVGSIFAAGQLVVPSLVLPASVRYTLGAIVVSLLVFATLAFDLGYLASWLVLAAGLGFGVWRVRSANVPISFPGWPLAGLVATYTAVYFIYALAPEVEPDAVGYHLRLVSDSVRTHALGDRLGFYDVLPQPVEMLFTPAFSLGAHSAVRLVHYTFLLVAALGIRNLTEDARSGWFAAVIFLASPVAAIAGTSAYTDLALVCATTSGFYLIRRPETVCVALAGACAGFAYAVKPTFGLVAIPAVAFVAWRARRVLPPLLFTLAAMAVAAPWLWHAWSLTGNPVAPFLSRFFPNGATTPEVEQRLVHLFSAFRPDFSWRTAILDYTVRGGNAGILGPAFLLAPVALVALRKKEGRTLLIAAAVLSLPVLANTGTRFLLPAAALMAVVLVSVLPTPAAVALVVLQVAGTFAPLGEWHLPPVPWRAALRLTPENEYLRGTLPGYDLVEQINSRTPVGSRILACSAIPEAYLRRETLVYWQNRQGLEFTELLRFAHQSPSSPARLLSWRWPDEAPANLRLTARSEFRLVDTTAPHRPWQRFSPGDVFTLAGAGKTDVLLWPDDQAQLRIEADSREISSEAGRERVSIDLRRDIAQHIRHAGYRYLVVPSENSAFAEITNDMRQNPTSWGVSAVAESRGTWLFRILPPR